MEDSGAEEVTCRWEVIFDPSHMIPMHLSSSYRYVVCGLAQSSVMEKMCL